MIPRQCHNCGKFTSPKTSGAVEFDTSDKFRKNRPDVSKYVYLCPKCAEDDELVGIYIGTPWYAGHRKIEAKFSG